MSQMHVQVRAPRGTDDYLLELADAEVTVGEVFAALELPAETQVDGAAVADPASKRAVDALVAGTQLVAPQVVRLDSAGPAGEPVVDVAIIAGLDAGRTVSLGAGDYRVDQHWLVRVAAPALASPVQAAPWHVHGSLVEAVVEPVSAIALSPPVASENLTGRAVHRPPRHHDDQAVEPIERVAAPDHVKQPSPLSWSTLLAPIPIALMMAFFFRPIFALFAAMGPVMAIGRWFESRRRYRREVAARTAAVAEIAEATALALAMQAEAIAKHRWRAQPHIAELWQRARNRSVRLWERRPETAGYLEFAVGLGPDQIASTAAGAPSDPVAHALLAEPLAIRAVPHVVDLDSNSGIGVYGQREDALAVARSLVLQLATLHGPADLRLGVVCDASIGADWDWLKWLPHTETALTATAANPVAKRLGELAPAGPPMRSGQGQQPTSPMRVIVIDHAHGDAAAIQRAAHAADVPVRFVVVAPQLTSLPAACSALVEVERVESSGGEHAVVARVSTPDRVGAAAQVCPIGVSADAAASWARSLSALVDPEMTNGDEPGEAQVSLLDLVGFESVEELSRRWAHRPPDAAAIATVGVGDDGPFIINLTEDGPHGLIAGTTGSGKSELLRTLVVGLAVETPPDLLNFVLVDFKGGGAFDAVAQLPHVAGLITDLDETLVARAIASLRSELHRRETAFRELGVSRFEDAVLAQPDDPPARLVVVIDEFAALATDYADLMSAIVDMAARGRSLGMHLVLATQRPSGVVDQKIRANTNLRVALRVQDAMDSQDVVGTSQAASIDRRAPGRAVISVGGDVAVTVQTAFSGSVGVNSDRCVVRPHRLFDRAVSDATHHAVDNASPTELQVLVDAIVAASASRGYATRPLWQQPLPPRLDWIDLGTRELGSPHQSAGASLGLEDLPDLQLQRPWRWDPDSGPLAVYAASAACAAKVVVSVGAALASSESPESMHLYVIDGDAGRVAPLQHLTHTGAYITLTETDRIERVIRLFEERLAQRRTQAADVDDPRLLLMIDNLAAVLANLGDSAAADFVDRLSALARDGSPQRIHLVMTARTVRDISHRLSQQFPNRLVLALADMGGYLTLGLKARDVPLLPEMRAIDLATSRLVQLVEPPDLTSWTAPVAAPPESRAQPVLEFPELFDAAELKPATIDHGLLRIPVGIEAERLQTVDLEMRSHDHALVIAANGMGRSVVVNLIVHQLQALADQVAVIIVNQHNGDLDADAIAASPTGVVVVVDDADRLPAPITKTVESLLDAHHAHVRFIVATTPTHARSVRSWVPRIRASGIGLVIGGTTTDGDTLGARLRPFAGFGELPGRGYTIARGRAVPTQFAMIETDPNAPTVNL